MASTRLSVIDRRARPFGSASQSAARRRMVTASVGYQRNPELQAAMDAMFADTIAKGRRRVPHNEVQHHIDRIMDLGRRLGLNRVHPEWNDGSFTSQITTQLQAITEESVCSLARLTFGRVQPAEAQVQIGQEAAAGFEANPDQFKGPLACVDGGVANGYSLVTYFRLLSNGAAGRMVLRGLYELDAQDPAKLNIDFVGFRVEPALTDPQSLALWREALAEHNPTMDASGGIEAPFEKRPRGWITYIMMDPDLQLHLAQSGSLYVMKRV